MPPSPHHEILTVHSGSRRRRRKAVYRGAKFHELDWSGIAKVAFITTAVIVAAYFALAM
ncbi:MAG: hypothetical protein AMXMBFR4_15320 [Candidatus Hydrogenedentota bacterium]